MILHRSVATLDPGPFPLVLCPTNLKSTVGQYIGKVMGTERGKKGGHTKVWPKEEEEMDRQGT